MTDHRKARRKRVYIEQDIMAEMYIDAKHKKIYEKQKQLIKSLTYRIRQRGYAIYEYKPWHSGVLFLNVDKKHKICDWFESPLHMAIGYAQTKHVRPIPVEWLNEVLDIVLNKNTDNKYLYMLSKIATFEWYKKQFN